MDNTISEIHNISNSPIAHVFNNAFKNMDDETLIDAKDAIKGHINNSPEMDIATKELFSDILGMVTDELANLSDREKNVDDGNFFAHIFSIASKVASKIDLNDRKKNQLPENDTVDLMEIDCNPVISELDDNEIDYIDDTINIQI